MLNFIVISFEGSQIITGVLVLCVLGFLNAKFLMFYDWVFFNGFVGEV